MTRTPSTVTLDLTGPWHVVTTSTAAPALLAVRELQDHWKRICGQPLLPGARVDPANTIELSVNDMGQDGFTWQVEPHRICIEGQSARGLLFGVYHFLEALGCRWLAPGALWTRVPRLSSVTLPVEPVFETPGLAGRCLIIGHYAFVIDVVDWIEWAARNRYNTLFLHTAPNDIGGGSVPEWAWLRVRYQAMVRMRERGLTLEIGGHGLPALLPRNLFKQMPHAFREEDGKRTKRHNFCPSSAESKAVVQANARRVFAENPGFDVYHIWADDIPGGGWCSCPQCAGLSASDQLLLATNMVAEALAEMRDDVRPGAEISFIAYLDTEKPPTQVAPRENVCLLWAPRTRNYGRAIDDETCPVNWPAYPDLLNAQIEAFAGAGSVRVFEYYSDAILFKSVLPILCHVMQADLRFYRNAGVHTVQTLMTGAHPWATAQLTNWLFGRLTWDVNVNVDALVADFCDAAFGAAGPTMVRYYAALEEAYALILNQTPDQRGHFELPASPLAMITDPLADMEDPVHAAAETLRRRAGDASTVLTLAAKAGGLLAAARRQADTPQLRAEATAFALVRAWLRFCAFRLKLYADIAETPPAPEAQAHWAAAYQSYEQILDWADLHLAPIFRDNLKALHTAMWELRLRRIQADHLSSPWQRWWIDAGTVTRLGIRFLQVYRGYKRAKG